MRYMERTMIELLTVLCTLLCILALAAACIYIGMGFIAEGLANFLAAGISLAGALWGRKLLRDGGGNG